MQNENTGESYIDNLPPRAGETAVVLPESPPSPPPPPPGSGLPGTPGPSADPPEPQQALIPRRYTE